MPDAALGWTCHLLNILVMAMLIVSALLAFAVRRNAVICFATLAFLPAVPAVLRYVLADPTIVSPDGDDSARYLLLGAINYGGVWGGFAAGLVFDFLGGRRGAKQQVDAAETGAVAEDMQTGGRGQPSVRASTTHDAA